MSGITQEKIKESSQVLETDLKTWLRQPITKKYFEMIAMDIARRKMGMTDEIDGNDFDATELKIRTECNKSARSSLFYMTDSKRIVSEFKEYNLLIEEEDSTDEI